jgi:hypothetical protein
MLWGPPTTLARTLAYNVYSNDALLGVVTRVVGETLIGFLILAALLVATGAADFFLKLALALMGTARGGPAKVAVLSSGFFGSLSGSIFANVVSTGAVTIPSMRRAASGLLRRRARSLRLDGRHADAAGDGRGRLHHGRLHQHRICGDRAGAAIIRASSTISDCIGTSTPMRRNAAWGLAALELPTLKARRCAAAGRSSPCSASWSGAWW